MICPGRNSGSDRPVRSLGVTGPAGFVTEPLVMPHPHTPQPARLRPSQTGHRVEAGQLSPEAQFPGSPGKSSPGGPLQSCRQRREEGARPSVPQPEAGGGDPVPRCVPRCVRWGKNGKQQPWRAGPRAWLSFARAAGGALGGIPRARWGWGLFCRSLIHGEKNQRRPVD